MVRWEYMASTAPSPFEDFLKWDSWGADGWELVSVVQHPDGSERVAGYFRRAVRICPDCGDKLALGTELLEASHRNEMEDGSKCSMNSVRKIAL